MIIQHKKFDKSGFYMSLLLPTLLPDNVIPQHIGQLHRLAIAQAAAFQFVRQIGDAAASTVFIG